MDKFYVYIYYDPRKDPPEPIYVGKGCNLRYKHHTGSKVTNSHLANKISKIRQQGFEPIVCFYKQKISNEEARVLEVKLITKFGRADKHAGSLCNWTDGGEGTSGYKHKPETIQIFKIQRTGKKQTKAQYFANCNRKPCSVESQKLRSLANKGHHRHSQQQLKILRSNEYNARNFTIVYPDGITEKISNLSKFCRLNSLDRTTATKAATKGITYRGFRFIRS